MEERMKFPEEGVSREELERYINPGDNYSPRAGEGVFLGYPQSAPHPIAAEVYKNYVPFNENHVGMFSNCTTNMNITRTMEKQLIEMLGGLYGNPTVDGYVTSGGTEGNIMGVWIGKSYLERKHGSDICLLRTCLTHQSIEKASNMCGIKNRVEIPMNDEYQIDVVEFEKQIRSLLSEGKNRFLLIATVGYTMTGTMDSIREMNEVLLKLKRTEKFELYCHVDAAIGGLVYPFIESDDFGFQFTFVNSISVDPHKMGYIPYAAGVFMCRRGLQDYIAVPIKYAREIMDKTLISSRNGAAAAACWVTFQHLGKTGFQNRLKALVKMKQYMIERLLEDDSIMVISNPPTNMVCVHFNFMKEELLPKWIEHKYILDAFKLTYKGSDTLCYKMYIMPHVTEESIDEFVTDVRRVKEIIYEESIH